MTVAKKFVLRKVFDGEPKSNDLSLEEENMKEVQYGGESLCHAVLDFYSVEYKYSVKNT